MENANRIWLDIPADVRAMLVKNVYCSQCKDAVEIKNYIIKNHKLGIVLEGKCAVCGTNVVRVID